MSEVLLEKPVAASNAIVVHLRPVIDLTDDEFFTFCQVNSELRFERTAEGDLIIMTPTGWETGVRNADITTQFRTWAKRDGRGVATDSSTGFKLPNGADRSPDAAWVLRSRLAELTPAQKNKFLPLCPDFVIELLSPTDTLEHTQAKMDEYIENGAQLGWLIDPQTRRVHIYRPEAEVKVSENPAAVDGAPLLTGFTLDLREIWEPNI